jgi:hypothetical protein
MLKRASAQFHSFTVSQCHFCIAPGSGFPGGQELQECEMAIWRGFMMGWLDSSVADHGDIFCKDFWIYTNS